MVRIIILFAVVWAIVVFSGCAEQQNNKPQPAAGQNSKWVKMEPSDTTQVQKEKQPDINPTTYFAAAVLLENQGNFTAAIDKYNKAIDMNPTYYAAYNRLGEIHLKLQQFDQAEAVYQKALKNSPNDPAQLNNLAFVHLTQHRYADAEKELTKALKLAPTFQRAHVNLGVALAKQGKYPESLNHFRAACPEAQANYNLAIILHAEGKADLAKKYYLTAMKFNPEFKEAQQGLKDLESRRPAATSPATTSAPAQ